MRILPVFATIFLVVPIIEIYLLIQVGQWIGVLPTILLVILTAVLGGFLLRQQGLSTLSRVQQALAQGQLPAGAMLEGLLLAIGGALLLTPGFFTDFLGLLCLLPLSRQALVALVFKNFSMKLKPSLQPSQETPTGFGSFTPKTNRSTYSNQSGNTFDGEYTRK